MQKMRTDELLAIAPGSKAYYYHNNGMFPESQYGSNPKGMFDEGFTSTEEGYVRSGEDTKV